MDTAQERAEAAAAALQRAVTELAGSQPGDIVVIVRSSGVPLGTDLVSWVMSWDWFWRPSGSRPEGGAPGDAG